jgi:integrator complex subunit 3
VALKLSEILRDQFEGKIFPENPTAESIEDSVGQPLFVMFRTLCEINETDPNRSQLLSRLLNMDERAMGPLIALPFLQCSLVSTWSE